MSFLQVEILFFHYLFSLYHILDKYKTCTYHHKSLEISHLLLLSYIYYSKNKIKNLKISFFEEIKEITEKLSKLAYGNLTTSFDLKKNDKNKNLNYLNDEIFSLKKQFNEITSEPLNRICYVGADPYHEGYNSGIIFGENCPINSEIIVLVTSNLNTIYIFLRVKGFTTVLKEKYPSLKITEIACCWFEVGGIFAYIGAAVAGGSLGSIMKTYGWEGFFTTLSICGIISIMLLSFFGQ